MKWRIEKPLGYPVYLSGDYKIERRFRRRPHGRIKNTTLTVWYVFRNGESLGGVYMTLKAAKAAV